MINFEIISSLKSRLVSIESMQPIHKAAYEECTDALLTLIAWGATGNEQSYGGSVFKLALERLCFHDRNICSKKIV